MSPLEKCPNCKKDIPNGNASEELDIKDEPSSEEDRNPKKPARVQGLILAVVLGYSLGMCICLEIANKQREGGALQSYYREYAHGGSKKWRGFWGNAFQKYILMPGVLVYPLCVLGIVQSIRLRKKTAILDEKPQLLVIFFVFIVILLRFIYLGVFSAAIAMW